MAIAPLDQRLAGILPEAATAAAPLTDATLEPMPAEDTLPDEPMADFEPGTPNMQEGVQVAGPASAALRKLITKTAPKAERNLVPDAARAAEGTLPDATKEGRFKVIPEADQTLTDQVGAAVKRRQTFGATQGKPGGVPDEPFNLSRYQTEDAAGVVGGVADALGIKTKSVTFDEIKAKAAESGISENFLSRLVGNDGRMMANAVETYKALEVLESSANELDKLFKMVDSGQATEVDMLKLRQQIAFHGLIQKGVKGMQSETARALAVFRIPRDGKNPAVRQVLDQFGGDKALKDMARSYMTLETRAAKNAMVEKSMMSGVKDIWFTTFINGLLSSPVSHAKNIVGNATFGLYQIPERLVASLYSQYLPKAVREGRMPNVITNWGDLVPGSAEDKIAFDEALTMMQSLTNGVTEGLQLAGKAWKTNQPNDLMEKIEDTRSGFETLGGQLQRVTGASPDTWLGKGMEYYGTAITVPGRALLTEDEFFKGVFYRMELNTQITRRAKKIYRDSVAAGMDEPAALAKAEAEAASLLANPPSDLDQAATLFAQKGTFTSDLPPFLAGLQKGFNHPAMKVIVPFFKTPANIGLQITERTIFAPLSKNFREEVAKGGVYRDMALAKMTMGSAILATLAAASAEGRITGSGPLRKADREALMRTGWQPYSIKVGDKWMSYSGLEPVSAFLAIAADYAEYAQREDDDSKIEEVFVGGTMAFAEYMKELPMLQGLSEVASFLGLGRNETDNDDKRFLDTVGEIGGNFAIGGSPAGAYSSMVAAIERLYDPTTQDVRASPDLPMGVRGFVEAFNRYRSRIPAFNESLPNQVNLWGDERKSGQGKMYEMVLPTRVSPEQFSEVDDILVRMGSPIGMPERKIQGVEMDAFQYNRLITIYAKELGAKDALLSVMTGPGFDMLNLDDQQKMANRVHSQYMDMARKQLVMEFPELGLKIEDLGEARKAQGLYYKPN
jgi:hypothetical protein